MKANIYPLSAASNGNIFDAEENIINDEICGQTVHCIMGYSIINGLDGRRLERNDIKVKVRCFPGANILDM